MYRMYELTDDIKMIKRYLNRNYSTTYIASEADTFQKYETEIVETLNPDRLIYIEAI